MANIAQPTYAFGPFRLHSSEDLLERNGNLIRLTPKAAATLLLLVKRSGHIVTKEEFLQEVWLDTFVEEGILYQNIATLRRVLGESPDSGAYIETIPKRGYRFRATVKIVESDSLPENLPILNPGVELPFVASDSTAAQSPTKKLGWVNWGLIFLLLIALAAGSFYFWHTYRSGKQFVGTPVATLAVLPVQNLTGHPEDDYLCVGVSDELITQLRQVSASHLLVIAYSSVWTLKVQAQSNEKVQEILGADYLLESKLVWIVDEVTVQSQLIRARDKKVLWSGVYLPDIVGLLNTRQQVSAALSSDMRVKFEAPASLRAGAMTTNQDAYRSYLKGRYYWNARTRKDLEQAVLQFNAALASDPTYARAYAGLADCYNLMVYYGWIPGPEGIPRANAASHKALELDDQLAEAHAALGYSDFFWNHDWQDAGLEFQKAIQLDPAYIPAHQWFALYLVANNRSQGAIEHIQIALRLDPLSNGVRAGAGYVYYFSRQYGNAIEQCDLILSADPDFMIAHAVRGLALEQKGSPEDAVKEFERAVQLQGGVSPIYFGYLAHAEISAGRNEEGRRILDRLERVARHDYAGPVNLAAIYVALGQNSEAVRWLRSAIDNGDGAIVWLRVDPRFDALRNDSQFQQMLRSLDSQSKSAK